MKIICIGRNYAAHAAELNRTTALDAEGMSAVIDPVIDACGAETVDSPEGVEVMRRTADDGTVFTTVINTAGRPVRWPHALGGEDLDLAPFETRIM